MQKLKKNIVRGGVALSSLLLGGASAFAQTVTPGAPTTALGGNLVMNIFLVVLGCLVMLVGAAMYRQRKTAY